MRTLLDVVGTESSPNDKTGDHLKSIRYAAEQMNSLIDTVYFYTRLDGAEPIEREVCGANAMIEAAEKNISRLIDERRAVITSSVLPQISANREQLVQVFQNLLSNAIQNCATTPRIDITFEETPDHWQFRVSDNGTGIDKQDADKLFMPFKRLSHHKMQGPGLGLATCRKIIGLHGGKIWFETTPTNGTDFIFNVAKGATAGVTQTAVTPSLPIKHRDERAQKLATLLLVDDDEMAIELTQIQLIDANHLQCEVLVARDGLEALARLRDNEIDLVLLDINMPRMDGFELLERMRAEGLLEHVSVVMCSTSTYQEDISKAKELGARGYLPKPPDFSRLRSILENCTPLKLSEVESGHHVLRAA